MEPQTAESNRKKRRQSQAKLALSGEALEARQLLTTVSVGNVLDVENGDTSSIAALMADDGGDGISLREAITAANNTSGADVITFDGSLTDGVIRLSGLPLTITEETTIDGADLGITITGDAGDNDELVDGTSITDVAASDAAGVLGDNSRVLRITGADSTTTLRGLTITGGRTTSSRSNGGGILSDAPLVLTNSSISGNSTRRDVAGGGGIYRMILKL